MDLRLKEDKLSEHKEYMDLCNAFWDDMVDKSKKCGGIWIVKINGRLWTVGYPARRSWSSKGWAKRAVKDRIQEIVRHRFTPDDFPLLTSGIKEILMDSAWDIWEAKHIEYIEIT